ncbi:MAG TPA: tail length tape measure protein [Cyanobacteria bacterium UBA8803]|nr:tail length tape measure protein [Cyanobacteria bacterium UBA9273]HBL61025.1 tail length tape measure protein [Cyanobacteria bacterium UBA8803]
MLKEQKSKLPMAVGAGLLLVALLLSSVFAVRKIGLLDIWTSGEKSENILSPTKEDAKSEVLQLVSQPPQQRASQLEAIASKGKSLEKSRARYLLASDLIQQKQGEAALKWLEGLESDYAILASHVVLKRARAYETMGDKARATAAWEELLKNYPNDPAAAEALYALGQSNPAYWNQAIAQFPAHPSTLTIVRQRLSKTPNQPALLLHLAKYAPDVPGTGDVRDVLVDRYASQLKPEDWQAIAFGYWQTREYGKAGKAYAKAPRTPLNAYRAGRGYHLKGKRAEAKIAYQQLIKQFPDAKETGLGLRRLASLSKSEEALVYLDRVISKFPDEAAEALLAKAEILDAMGSSTSAAQARQSVLNQYASSNAAAEYRWQVARQKAAAGKIAEAWQWTTPITTESPDSPLAPEAAFWVGRWAAQLGRQKDAKAAFEHVLARYPESFFAWRSARFLGWDVGDFTTVRDLTPEIVKPPVRAVPPTGSDTLKELYQLGQNSEAWALWQVELKNRQEPTVTEQFTDGLIRLGVGDNINGINQVWNLSLRDKPEERQQWQALRSEPGYWYTLFPTPFIEPVMQWSSQRQLNPLLVMGLIRQESRFEPKIRSIAGAKGLMQVMPGTGKWIADKIQLKSYNLENPSDNIKLGTWYLDHTHAEYNNHSLLAVASYNAGPGNVAKWVRQYGFTDADAFIERIPFAETKGYVESVFENYWNYLRLYNPEIGQLLKKYAPQQQIISRQ